MRSRLDRWKVLWFGSLVLWLWAVVFSTGRAWAVASIVLWLIAFPLALIIRRNNRRRQDEADERELEEYRERLNRLTG